MSVVSFSNIMSWLPLYNSWLICFTLISLFFWSLAGVGTVLLFVLPLSLVFLFGESLSWGVHYSVGFWLFIGSEVIVFLALFFLVLYYETETMLPLSNCTELPLLGSFLLLGSSVTVTCYHHCMGLSYNWANLCLTLLLGGLFLVLQLFEFHESSCDLLNDSFYCSCFCTVGLHFLHVVVGFVVLSFVLVLLPRNLDFFYGDLAVWYWHFVDYIWLVVFLVVYCSEL